MRTYCIEQRTLLNVLWWSKQEGNPKKEGKYVYIHITDSFCCTAETNTTLKTNYTLIQNKKQKKNTLVLNAWRGALHF